MAAPELLPAVDPDEPVEVEAVDPVAPVELDAPAVPEEPVGPTELVEPPVLEEAAAVTDPVEPFEPVEVARLLPVDAPPVAPRLEPAPDDVGVPDDPAVTPDEADTPADEDRAWDATPDDDAPLTLPAVDPWDFPPGTPTAGRPQPTHAHIPTSVRHPSRFAMAIMIIPRRGYAVHGDSKVDHSMGADFVAQTAQSADEARPALVSSVPTLLLTAGAQRSCRRAPPSIRGLDHSDTWARSRGLERW